MAEERESSSALTEELKRVEARLAESEARYDMLVEQSPDNILIHDLEGTVLFTNISRVEVLGAKSPEEVVGRNAMEFIHPDDREMVMGVIGGAFEDFQNGRDSKRTIEHRMLRLDGTEFWGEATGVFFVYDGKPAIQTIIRDITARKEAEEELKRYREQLEELVKERTSELYSEIEERKRTEEALKDQINFLLTLINTIPSPVFYKDTEGRYLGCNAAFEESVGLSSDDICGKTVYDLAPKEVADKYFEMDSALFDKPGVQVYECPVRYTDGKEHDIIFHKAIFSRSDGSVAGLVGVMLDITEGKRSKAAIEDAVRKFRTIFESSSDAIMLFGDNGFIDCNNATLRMFGCSESEEFLGTHPGEWSPPEQPDGRDSIEAANSKIARAFKEGRNFFEWTHKRADGESFQAEVLLTPMQLEGKMVLQATVRDITERRRLEYEKSELHSQLLQSQKMEAIGTLAGGIAHDFNNIMTVVKSLSSLALTKVAPGSKLYEYLKPIENASDRCTGLIQQLLIFSQRKPCEVGPLSVNDTIENLLGMLRSLIDEDISINEDLCNGLWEVSGDRGRLEQVLINLIINSSDAMPQGGCIRLGTENVTLTKQEASGISGAVPGDYVRMTVDDDGIGIEPEVIEHIFEPFFSTKSHGGNGLGLSVVYGILKEMNGCVDVSSEPGAGSKFSVYLPATTDPVGGAQEASVNEFIASDGQGRRILLVEDDMWVRRSTAMALMENGYIVEQAEDAEQAIAIFFKEKGRFDLVITDVVMPGRDGLQMMEPLFEVNPGIPVLFYSGHVDNKAQLDSIIKKGFAFLQKPYEVPDLLRAIEESMVRG